MPSINRPPWMSNLFRPLNHRLSNYLFPSSIQPQQFNLDALNRLVGERPVVIFSKTSCCMSHTIKSLITGFGANPTVYELDKISNGKQIEKTLIQLGYQPSVPAVFIAQRLVGGERQVMSFHVQGRLVPMLMEAGALWL